MKPSTARAAGKRRVGHHRLAFRARMEGAAIDRRHRAPACIVDVGRLHGRRQPARIGHRGEVAVVGGADPARARRIGTELARPQRADQRAGRRLHRIGLEAVAFGREALAVELRILLRARADAVVGEFGLMGVDEGHAVGVGIGAFGAGLAARQRLDPRQEAVQHEIGDVLQPCGIGVEAGMDVETVAAAGAGLAAQHRGMAVGNDRRRGTGCRRPAASARREAWRSCPGKSRSRRTCACGTVASWPPWLNSVRSTPVLMMTSATRPANLMSLAPTVSRTRSSWRVGSCWRALASMSCNWPSCGGTEPAQAPRAGQSLAPCDLEQAVLDGRAGAGERQEGDGDLRVLHRERERGAELIAVQRAVARRRHPAGAVAVPVAGVGGRAGGVVVAGLVALVARPGRPEIFGARGAKEAAEAEAVIGKRDRAVGIAFAGRDRVAEPRDQQIADRDLGGDAVDAAVRPGDADRGDGRLAVGEALLHRLRARRGHLLRRNGAVVEAPVAGGVGRHRAGRAAPRLHGSSAPDSFPFRRRGRRCRAGRRRR